MIIECTINLGYTTPFMSSRANNFNQPFENVAPRQQQQVNNQQSSSNQINQAAANINQHLNGILNGGNNNQHQNNVQQPQNTAPTMDSQSIMNFISQQTNLIQGYQDQLSQLTSQMKLQNNAQPTQQSFPLSPCAMPNMN